MRKEQTLRLIHGLMVIAFLMVIGSIYNLSKPIEIVGPVTPYSNSYALLNHLMGAAPFMFVLLIVTFIVSGLMNRGTTKNAN